jgi:hypothetical protein
VAATGFEHFWKGDSKPIPRSEKKIVLSWTQKVYIINHRKAEKLIPGNFNFEGETYGFETI